METVDGIAQNLTSLDDSLDTAVTTLENLGETHHLAAETSNKYADKERGLSSAEKDRAFDE